MPINLKRLALGGSIASFLIILSALTMVPVVGNEMDQVLADRGLPPLSNLDILYFCFVSLFFGFFLVWLYAVIKAKFGPGPKTAAIAALILWVIGYLLPNVSMIAYGFMPIRLTVIGTVWGLGELMLAILIASRIYKD